MDRYRLLAGDGQPRTDAPKPVLLAAAMVRARQDFDRAVYQTIAADRGHVGRGFAALDRIPRKRSRDERGREKFARWRNNFGRQPWKIGERLLCDGKKRGTIRRAVPAINSDLLLLDGDSSHRVPVLNVDLCATKVATLLQQVAVSRGVPVDGIRLLLGNAVLPPALSLFECSVQHGTVLVYSLPTGSPSDYCGDSDDDGPSLMTKGRKTSRLE